jgi:hypothetical protein
MLPKFIMMDLVCAKIEGKGYYFDLRRKKKKEENEEEGENRGVVGYNTFRFTNGM